MKEENAIEVHHVYKQFRVYLDKGHTLKEMTLFSKRRQYEKRTVLNDISFEVKKGEAIGLIGQNGCGKSTTLKLLTRIMYPDSGSIEMKGRVSSLIELGAGFHPDMSGRQNIYTNAAIFGLNRKEIEERLDDIIAFSELEEFIDNPVRTYSSGMYMRLAFAVAINVNADILLIDEILAVGDANYQAKCFNKLREIKAQGTTIVIVSHSLGQIEQICERSIWIEGGKIRAEGKPREVHPMYLDFMGVKRQEIIEKEAERQRQKEAEKREEEERIAREKEAAEQEKRRQEEIQAAIAAAKAEGKAEAEAAAQATIQSLEEEVKKNKVTEKDRGERWGSGKARITGITITDMEGKKKNAFRTGDDLQIHVDYEVRETVHDAVFGIGVFRVDELHAYGTNTRIDRMDPFDLTENGSFTITIRGLCLLPAEYTFDFALEEGLGIAIDYYTKAASIQVFSEFGDVGLCRLAHEWTMNMPGTEKTASAD